MNDFAALLLVLCLLPVATATAAGTATGTDGSVEVSDGLLVLRGPSEAYGNIREGQLLIVDDYWDQLDTPEGVPVFANYGHSEKPYRIINGTVQFTTDDGLLLLRVWDSHLDLVTTSSWIATETAGEVLEDSHVYYPEDQNEYYYAEWAPAGVNWTAPEAQFGLEGHWRAYAWDTRVTLTTSAGPSIIRTGRWVESPTPGALRVHNVYAVFVADGTLDGLATAPVHLYASLIEVATSGIVTLDGIRLPAPGPGEAGRYHFTTDDDQLAAINAPQDSLAAQDEPWPIFLILAAGALFSLLATLAILRIQSEAWMLRADQRLQRGHLRRAAICAALAVIGNGREGEAWAQLANATADLELNRLAAASYARAYRRLTNRNDKASVAYEAARVHAKLGRASTSAHWLMVAIRLDPNNVQSAMTEPDFGRVAARTEFQAIIRRVLDPHGATSP